MDYYQEFEFIYNTFLAAEMNSEGKQRLLVLNEEKKIINSLSCIHTAIGSIPVENFLQDSNQDINKKIKKMYVDATSTEKNQKAIEDLTLNEKFFAFKSWVQGIAESGIESFYLQSELEQMAKFYHPISTFLIQSLIKINKDFFGIYIEFVAKKCQFEGAYHKSSIISNLNYIFNLMQLDLKKNLKNYFMIKIYMSGNLWHPILL